MMGLHLSILLQRFCVELACSTCVCCLSCPAGGPGLLPQSKYIMLTGDFKLPWDVNVSSCLSLYVSPAMNSVYSASPPGTAGVGQSPLVTL